MGTSMPTRLLCLIGLAVLPIVSSASAQTQETPFDTAAAPSEQLSYAAKSPQVVARTAGTDGLLMAWQAYDADAPSSVRITRYSRHTDFYALAWHKRVPLSRLVGMTTDGTHAYVLSAAAEDLSRELTITNFRPDVLVLTKLDARGDVVWQRDLNTAAYLGEADGGAVFSPLRSGSGALAYGAGKIVVALASNTLPDENIGQRHQRAQYFVVGEDGSGFQAASETSWRHSFDQRLLFDGTDFVFTDLGDGDTYMPGAGIALRKIKPSPTGADFVGDLQGVYIYARQGGTGNAQNFSFTSLGDLVAGTQGYAALFSSETTNPGVLRDGWAVPVAEPRNLGFVHVTRAFDAVQEGSWNGTPRLGNTIIENNVPTAIRITPNVVDSAGPSSTFTRADDATKSITQTGIVWLTDLPAGVSAERPKLIKVSDNQFVALWEEWTYADTQLAYQATKALLVDEYGTVLQPAVSIAARLNPSGADPGFALDGAAAWIAHEGRTPKLHRVDSSLALRSEDLTPSDNITVPGDTLSVNESLAPGQFLQAGNGRCALRYLSTGNLTLDTGGARVLWQSGTAGQAGRALMQADGNFVLLGPTGERIWETGTSTRDSRLVVQTDCNVVVRGPDGATLWQTGTTAGPDDAPSPAPQLPPETGAEEGAGREAP
jgi:hypothetical protein